MNGGRFLNVGDRIYGFEFAGFMFELREFAFDMELELDPPPPGDMLVTFAGIVGLTLVSELVT